MIDFEHVTKIYKRSDTPALEDIDFHVDDGEFVFLVGHSGAGKSTLLKLILREELPTEGRVMVDGKDVARLRRGKVPFLRRQMGIIFQDFRLIPTMTVYENVAFAMHVTNIGKKDIKERVNYMLELVHLEDKAKVYPEFLSGGEQQRVAVARALALSVCMTLNIFASLIEVNVDSMVSYLGSQNEMVVYVDPEADDATIQSVGNALSGTAGVSRVQYMSKEDVLNQYKGYMSDYAALLNEFENDNPFKANYRVSLSDLSQMETISKQFENISGVYSVTAPIEMTRTFVEVQQAVTKVGRGLVLVLMAVSIITVGTTIRLSVFARRREIEIMKYVGATNALVTLPFVIEGLTMGLLSGILTAAATIGGYAYIVQLSPTLGGLWQMLMGTALVPLENVWPTILTYSLAGGALVGGLGSMFSIRKHLNV